MVAKVSGANSSSGLRIPLGNPRNETQKPQFRLAENRRPDFLGFRFRGLNQLLDIFEILINLLIY